MTYGLLASNLVMYLALCIADHQVWSITTRTLVAFGGLDADLVHQGEYWRLLCAPFLHRDLLGLAVDLVLLGMVCGAFESAWGSARALVSCLFFALCASALVAAAQAAPWVGFFGVSLGLCGVWISLYKASADATAPSAGAFGMLVFSLVLMAGLMGVLQLPLLLVGVLAGAAAPPPDVAIRVPLRALAGLLLAAVVGALLLAAPRPRTPVTRPATQSPPASPASQAPPASPASQAPPARSAAVIPVPLLGATDPLPSPYAERTRAPHPRDPRAYFGSQSMEWAVFDVWGGMDQREEKGPPSSHVITFADVPHQDVIRAAVWLRTRPASLTDDAHREALLAALAQSGLTVRAHAVKRLGANEWMLVSATGGGADVSVAITEHQNGAAALFEQRTASDASDEVRTDNEAALRRMIESFRWEAPPR